MKNALIIPIFNRPEYVARCFDSLQRADLTDTAIILIDDGSTDKRTIELIERFSVYGNPVLKYRQKNEGVKGALSYGIQIARQYFNPKYFINLDSDAIVKPDFIQKLTALKERFPKHIVSGFNSMTRNRDGSERHIVLKDGEDFCVKKSIGGINMVFDSSQANRVISVLEKPGNWDHELSKLMESEGNPMICIKPSVVQHIGIRSSMGHNHDQPDVAEDFDAVPKLKLKNVALFILDTKNPKGLIHAVKESTKEIDFGQVIALTSNDNFDLVDDKINNISNFEIGIIHGINSKEDYSRFMIQDLAHYLIGSKCTHVLVIQADGYVLNPSAWSDEFLNFDYIGAKWWYDDKYNVGNGGFSLRSVKLINYLATDEEITETHPEDEKICRTHGKRLQSEGFKFATETIADKFSFEQYGKKSNLYTGSFGFHGLGINFRNYPKLSNSMRNVVSGARPRSYGHIIR